MLHSFLSVVMGEIDLNLPGMDVRDAEWRPEGGGDLLGGAPGCRVGPTNGNGIGCGGFRNCRLARKKGDKR